MEGMNLSRTILENTDLVGAKVDMTQKKENLPTLQEVIQKWAKERLKKLGSNDQ